LAASRLSFLVPKEYRDLEQLGWPKCDNCGQTMRLVGLEPHGTNPHASLHTYECECGEDKVVEIAQM
jgi:hypothetical protein